MRRELQTFIVVSILLAAGPALAQQPQDRTGLFNDIIALRQKLKTLEDAFLEPSREDLAAFPEYTNGPGLGLIRILPREKYDNARSLTVRGGGAYYSFVRLTHEYGYGSDIELAQGNLAVGFAGADYGMLVDLGNFPLKTLAVDSPEISWLVSYASAATLPDARAEQRRAAEGIEIGDLLFKERVPALLHHTYALRSVDYDHSDVLVGLSIVRRDADGSLIIAWKLLKDYGAPKLQRSAR